MISLIEPVTTAVEAEVMPVRNDAEAREFFDRLVVFGKWFSPAGKCFHGWDDAVLRNYLAFHLLQKTLAFAPGPDGEINGLGLAFRVNEAALLAVDRFDWTPDDPAGDSLCFLQWIAVNGAARRAMMEWFARRYPDWRRLKLIHWRRGKLRRVPPAVIGKLLSL